MSGDGRPLRSRARESVRARLDRLHRSPDRSPATDEPARFDAAGLPIPPSQLIGLVSHLEDADYWVSSGELDARLVRERLEDHAGPLAEAEAVLDFGCGCGRVLRHWAGVAGPRFFGSDYDPRLTAWCEENLPFATVITNGAAPPLAFDAESFDLIYAISLFTHLAQDSQRAWMAEITRVLKPGGVLLFTTHGELFSNHLTATEADSFGQGELVVHRSEVSGMEACAAFHPVSFVQRRLLAEAGLQALETIAGDWTPDIVWTPMVLQDKHVARKPAA